MTFKKKSHRDRKIEAAGLHGLRKQVIEVKEGPLETGLAQDELLLPAAA